VALTWTRLSCHDSRDNEVRLQLFVLAYNLGNFLRQFALPRRIQHWSLTTLREKLIKIGAKVVRRSKYVTFQPAEVAVPREPSAAILEKIDSLRWSPGTGQGRLAARKPAGTGSKGGVCPKQARRWPWGGDKGEKRVVSVSKPGPKALRGKNSVAFSRRPAKNRGEKRRSVDLQGSIWGISV
jgi:hypothetical protein